MLSENEQCQGRNRPSISLAAYSAEGHGVARQVTSHRPITQKTIESPVNLRSMPLDWGRKLQPKDMLPSDKPTHLKLSKLKWTLSKRFITWPQQLTDVSQHIWALSPWIWANTVKTWVSFLDSHLSWNMNVSSVVQSCSVFSCRLLLSPYTQKHLHKTIARPKCSSQRAHQSYFSFSSVVTFSFDDWF